MGKYKILIVDDDEFVCEDIATSLDHNRFEIDKAYCSDSAFNLFKEKQHHIVITDLQMKKSRDDGFLLLEKIKVISPSTAVMILTNHNDIQKAVKAMRLGALDYVTKPYETDQIAIKIYKMIDHVAMTAENDRLRNELSSQYEIIGESRATAELKNHITLIAKTDSSVLITGPNGSGKELVAWNIHNQSNRSGKAFIIVNCAAIPENLVESELFGTMKGAFTGALNKKGKFEQAHEGTIFLDEVGDMSLATQAKVLRVLQDGIFTRIGGEKALKIDVRIISATNKDLLDLIKQNKFREDLFYRINVAPLHTVPLRQRKDDVPLLIEYKLRRMGKPSNLSLLFTQDALAFLKAIEWNGNVRELNNAIERLIIFRENKLIDIGFIRKHLTNELLSEADFLKTCRTFRDACCNFEKEYIIRVIDECSGNMTDAANKLDLQRSYLYEKIKKLGINRSITEDVI